MEPQRFDPTDLAPASCAKEGLTGSEEANKGSSAIEQGEPGREVWLDEPEPPHEQQPPRPWGKAGSAAWRTKTLAGRTKPQIRSVVDAHRPTADANPGRPHI